jgi:hypothetical protein
MTDILDTVHHLMQNIHSFSEYMSLLSGERGQGDLLPFLFPPEDGDTPIL